jgi:hypothetical protein
MIFDATKNFSPSSFGVVVGSGIRDTGSGMDKNQDPGSAINIPDPQHCCKLCNSSLLECSPPEQEVVGSNLDRNMSVSGDLVPIGWRRPWSSLSIILIKIRK